MIDPDEANETYRTASAIAAFQLTQLAFAALVKKEILPKAEAEQNTEASNRDQNTRGYDFREGQGWALPSRAGPRSSRPFGTAANRRDVPTAVIRPRRCNSKQTGRD